MIKREIFVCPDREIDRRARRRRKYVEGDYDGFVGAMIGVVGLSLVGVMTWLWGWM